jgi:hypothetical protein
VHRFFFFFRTVFSLLAIVYSSTTHALPSFARQTGQPCAGCHVGGFGPQLTPYGMEFKLGGYTASDGKADHIPLAAMAVGSWSHTSKDQSNDAGPYDGVNNNASLQEVSGFLAGAITDHIGALVQTTYSDITRKVALDNVDIRYARTTELFGEDTILGLSINNNPTVQDTSNSMPAWRFPYMSSELALSPSAKPILNGGLEQQVVGVSSYAYWNDAIYAEIGGYKSLSKSFLDKVNADSTNAIDGIAPYWRLAYKQNGSDRAYSFGLFGLNASILPDRIAGKKDSYRDAGVDFSYQWLSDPRNTFSVDAAYTHERQILNATFGSGGSAHRSNTLNEFDVAASYYFEQTYGFSLAYFDITGSADSGIYTITDPDVGSRLGKPNSSGWIMQADWTPFGKAGSWASPWANLRVGAQYTMYDKFNGSSSNYDGFGRSASDNNTLFGFVWLAF